MLHSPLIQTWARIIGAFAALAGASALILAPFIGASFFATVWGVEPLSYIGAVLLIVALGTISLSYAVPHLMAKGRVPGSGTGASGRN